MAKIEKVLALDVGATSLKLGEFEYPNEGRIRLTGFTYREYGEELTEENRSVVIAGLLRELLLEQNVASRKALVAISGQSAFLRFVKLPPVAEDERRVRQIVEFEARQNVPFPIEQVIWDYQLLASPDTEEMNVMFVVVKNEIVQQITDAVQAVGIDPVSVEIAPVACYNAARANHVGDEECAMVLDIGGRSTSLLFADRQRFFARTIPIAGHSVTQQIAKEFGIGLEEAEELKRRHGFVALGGAYEEPESEVAAAVSKIVRNVMARLHGEINRSISVYRAQHKGARPTRLYLTGGSSIMAFTDHFFAEKLRMEVGYLNPFQVTELGPDINRRQLQDVAHMFSEVVGLGLRYRLECPVEISLVPKSIRRHQVLRQKKPYVAACLCSVLLTLFVALLALERKAGMYNSCYEKGQGRLSKLSEMHTAIKAELDKAEQAKADYEAITDFLTRRARWVEIMNELQRLKPPDVWLVSIKPIAGEVQAPAGGGGGGMMGGGGGPGGMMMGAGGGGMMGGGGAPGGMMMGAGGGMMGGPGEGGGMGAGAEMMGGAGGAGAEMMGGAGGGGGPGGMMMGGGGMMGGAGGGGMMGGGAGGGGIPGDIAQIGGLELAGYSVVLHEETKSTPGAEETKGGGTQASASKESDAEKKDGTATTAKSDPATKEQEQKGNDPGKGGLPNPEESTAKGAEVSEDTPDAGGLGNDMGPGLTPDSGEGSDEEKNAEPPDSTATPELLYLSRLRKSKLFDEDPTLTVIKVYQPSQTIRNVSAFLIQVKFKETLDFGQN